MTTLTDMPSADADISGQTTATRSGRAVRGVLWSSLADICQLLQLEMEIHDQTMQAQFQHRRLKPGQHAYSIGQTFDALYIVNAGYLKTVMFDVEGNERVVSFPMKGDLLGSDGIYTDRHASEVVALSDCDLIVIPFRQLLALGHSCQELEHLIYRVVSRQIVQENINLTVLGSLRSDARVARFLSMEADRHAALKFSAQSFRLRMTRREIGSYLGLTLETVSRSMSALDAAGIISVAQRDIQILKPSTLRSLQQLGIASADKTHDAKPPKTPAHTNLGTPASRSSASNSLWHSSQAAA